MSPKSPFLGCFNTSLPYLNIRVTFALFSCDMFVCRKCDKLIDLSTLQTNITMKNIIASIIFSLLISHAFATNVTGSGWNWGDGNTATEAKGNWMNLERLVKSKDYTHATAPLVWLLNNTPNLNVALYINAIKVYEKRALAEKDPALKLLLQDSTLMLYDRRIELFGDEANVLNRKGKVAWKFLSSRANTLEELYSLYEKIYSLNQDKTYASNLVSYMKASAAKYSKKELSKSEAINIYTNCTNVINKQLSNTSLGARQLARLEKYKARLNSVFVKGVGVGCDEIKNNFGVSFNNTPNLNNAKTVVNLCIATKCYNNLTFLQSAKFILNQEENFALTKMVGNVSLKHNKLNDAYTYFEKAIALTKDSTKQAALLFEMAKIDAEQGNYIKARTLSFNALAKNSTLTEIYSFVGDLYYNNAESCTSENTLQNRSVYIAAYNMYQKGGNTTGMTNAKAQFPSMEELFVQNKNVGDMINTGCWINENVALQKRN